MNDILSQALAQLNLQPGQRQRVQVNGYQVEIRRIDTEESDFADQVMLEPWVWFPGHEHTATLPVHHRPRPLPDPPVIPQDEEGNS